MLNKALCLTWKSIAVCKTPWKTISLKLAISYWKMGVSQAGYTPSRPCGSRRVLSCFRNPIFQREICQLPLISFSTSFSTTVTDFTSNKGLFAFELIWHVGLSQFHLHNLQDILHIQQDFKNPWLQVRFRVIFRIKYRKFRKNSAIQ